MSALALTTAQYAPRLTTQENLESMAPVVAASAQAGSLVVVFPEYSQAFSGRQDEHWVAQAEQAGGQFVEGLTSLSAAHGGITIVAGMLMTDPGDARPANTAVAVDASGLLAVAEKIHLYDAFGAEESRWVRPGTLDAPQLFSLGGFSIGMMACYDLRFPEVSRRLADAGADVIIAPAQWVPGPHKAHHFDTLLQARAIETQTFMVAPDHPAPHGIGLSQVVNPLGEHIQRAGVEEEVMHSVLERELLQRVREDNPMARARRFGVQPL